MEATSKRMLRVLMVLDSMEIGGTETHVLTLTRALLQRGVDVVFAAGKGALSDAFAGLGCRVYQIDFDSRDEPHEAISHQLVHQVRQILLREDITVIHAHQISSGRVALEATKLVGIPVIFTVHGNYYSQRELVSILNKCYAVISVSPPIYDWLGQNGIASNLIQNGINLDEFNSNSANEMRQKLKIPPDAPVILYASRLSWGKTSICKMLLKACKDLQTKEYPSLHLVIAGGGPRFAEIQNEAERIKRSRKKEFIHVLGASTDMVNCYAVSDCVVGTGRVALEAMACQKPVVAVGSHGFLGLVKPSNYQEAWNSYFGDHHSKRPCTRQLLYQTLQQAFVAPHALQELGTEGRGFVERCFNIENLTNTIVNLYLAAHRPTTDEMREGDEQS